MYLYITQRETAVKFHILTRSYSEEVSKCQKVPSEEHLTLKMSAYPIPFFTYVGVPWVRAILSPQCQLNAVISDR